MPKPKKQRSPRPRRIEVQIEGTPDEKGHVRLSDFVKKLLQLRESLSLTQKQLTGRDEPSVYWRVVDLRHQSPATIVLEEVPTRHLNADKKSVPSARLPVPVVDQFAKTMRQINQAPRLPDAEQHDLAALESYRALGVLREPSIASLTIKSGRAKFSLTDKFEVNLEKIIGPDELVHGSISGMLEAINIHNSFRFHIYPLVGPKKVSCTFEPQLKEKVLASIGKYVTVFGTLRYKSWAPFAHQLDARELEALPDTADLPTLADLRGIAPEATGELSAEDFVSKVRDEDW